jgi:hypothetical protein
MNTNKSLSDLPWSFNHAEHSAKVVLSRAAWLCVDREAAIQAVKEVAPLGLFDDTPHVLLQIWQTICEELAQPDSLELLAA